MDMRPDFLTRVTRLRGPGPWPSSFTGALVAEPVLGRELVLMVLRRGLAPLEVRTSPIEEVIHEYDEARTFVQTSNSVYMLESA